MAIIKLNMKNPCLYCGEEQVEDWDEMTKFYTCNCKDAKEVRRIEEEIGKLEKQKPSIKYQIETRHILSRKKL